MARSASPSWRQRVEDCVIRLRRIEGIEVTEAKLGKACSASALRKANERVAGGLGKTLTALYSQLDGFCVRWNGRGQVGELGVLPLAKMIGKGTDADFEDTIWNDEFVEQFDGSVKAAEGALAKVKRYRLLWSDSGQS